MSKVACPEMPDATITKGVCERYDVRLTKGNGWATITLDERGGLLNIVSDYGNYSHYWPNHGRQTFKHFLCELGNDYLLDKLGGRPSHFNYEKSKANVVERLKEMLRDGARVWRNGEYHDFNQKMYNDADDALDSLNDYSHSADTFAVYVSESDLNVISSDGLFEGIIVMEHSPQLRMFLERLWPPFIAQLKKEIGVT